MSPRRALALFALLPASALVLASCAGAPADPDETDAGVDDVRISVVASTSVYGQVAEEVGGDLVEVTSIVTSTAQDPHSFEPSAQDQLIVSRADLIIENGGGYDAFIDGLIEASGTSAPVITAVEFSHDWPGDAEDDHGHDEDAEEADDHAHEEDDHAHEEDGHDDHGHEGHGHVEGFNEHVWYDPHVMEHLAEAIADELSELLPEHAGAFADNAAAFVAEIGGLEASLAGIDTDHGGAAVFVTEPVPVYLVAAAGLVNVTPDAFSEAVEEGQDVPPATLLEALTLLRDAEVRVVIVNAQTGGAETTRVIGEADTLGIPVIEFAETLPEGQTYISWMQLNVEALADALER